MDYLLIFIVGSVIGSFLTVVIARLPAALEEFYQSDEDSAFGLIVHRLSMPRSHCPHCGRQLSLASLVPVVSYFWLRGKCAACGHKISPQYLLIELSAGLLAMWSWFSQDEMLLALAVFVFFAALLAASAIDLQHKIIPDEITMPLVWLGLLININHGFVDLEDALIGAVAAYLSLWLIFQFYYLVRKKSGLGFGDIKLFAAIGAWFGWQVLPVVLFISSLAGIIFFLVLWLQRKINLQSAIAFGPFLALGAWLYQVYLNY